MKIIIVGNGKVGYAIASQLAGEHHDITMVDSAPRRCTGRRTPLDVMWHPGKRLLHQRPEGGRTQSAGPGHRRDQSG